MFILIQGQKLKGLMFTRRSKTPTGSKIGSLKGNGINRLVCMLGDKLISPLVVFKRFVFDCLNISDSRFFLLKLEKKSVTRRF